ncbi:MAG: hypothetical protein QNJ32_05540 [Xenococcaceae cyanobacterium MO_167.B27]|nr:hypothetical protein [Xenococcaceae cyanobacterium MO_167.B27]
MTHSFLLQPGRWSINGYFRQKEEIPVTVRGFILITWKQEYWFKMVTQLILNNQSQSEIICKYKGHLDNDRKSYTYVLQHSILGNIEGEGWISSQSIIQYHWIVGASHRRTGMDTFYYLSEDVYHLTSVILESHNLSSVMEATLKYLI